MVDGGDLASNKALLRNEKDGRIGSQHNCLYITTFSSVKSDKHTFPQIYCASENMAVRAGVDEVEVARASIVGGDLRCAGIKAWHYSFVY